MPKEKFSTIAHPVDTHSSQFAQIYTNLHPALVLSIFLYRFEALITDPVPVLLSSLPVLAVLQTSYVAICLPSANDGAAVKGGKKRPATAREMGIGFRVVPALLSLFLSLSLAAPILVVGMILFGAPATTHQFHTLAAAAHLSLLTALPLVYVNGVDGEKWRRVVGLDVPFDEAIGGAVGTLVGAWVGAVPIPLDWDREWQRWPVTVVAGAYAGWAVGKMLGGYVVKGKRIRMD